MFKSKDGSTKNNKTNVSGKEASTSNDPRGGDTEKNTPESNAPVTPPSQKRPHNPSDAIEDQIEASDAKTKRPGTEFEKMSDEQVRDYAVTQGIDGNDGLSRDEIIGKIQAFQGKRMFDDPQKEGHSETSAELADRVHREGPDAVKEDLK